MIKIYGRANSINVRKVLWILDEIGLDYEREDWGRGFKDTKDPEFAKLSRFAIVPVMVEDGVIMRESHAIVRYLAAKHGRDDLYPADLVKRQEVEAWMDWTGIDTVSALRGAFLGGVVGQAPFNDPKQVEWGRKDLARLMGIVDGELAARGPYATGDSFTVGDIPIGLVVNRWFTMDLDRPDLPALAAYYDKLSERPAFMKHGRNGTP
jgi:glutathione S-transferase